MPGRVLNAVTWNHSRAVLPLVAASQRYSDEHPDVQIEWTRRPLAALQTTSIEKLAQEFDLLVLDQTTVAAAAAKGALVPLEKHIDKTALAELGANSIGASAESYVIAKKTLAIPFD